MITPAQAHARIQAAMAMGNVTPCARGVVEGTPSPWRPGELIRQREGRPAAPSVQQAVGIPGALSRSHRRRPTAVSSGFGSVQQPFTYTGRSICGANEPDIVQSSVNPNFIVAVVQAYQTAAGGCGDGHAFFATSHDAGLHWVQGGFPGAFNDSASGDVNVTFDPVHNGFIATFLEFTRDGAGNAIPPGRLAAEASPDGISWD